MKADPRNAERLHLAVVARHQAKKVKQARGLVERAIQVALENASYRVTLGQIFDKAGELPLAAAAYEAAVTLDPLDAETYFTLAGAWKRMGHFDTAIQCYEKIIGDSAQQRTRSLQSGKCTQSGRAAGRSG